MAIEWGWGRGRGRGRVEKLSNSASLSATTNRTKASLAFPILYTPVHTLIHQSIKFHECCTVAEPSKPLYIHSNIPSPYPRPE